MKEYDIIAIGNSPKVFIELLKYVQSGVKVLLINSLSNWNIIDFFSVKNVEDGCFFIDYKQNDYELLIYYLDIKLKKLKYEPYFIYKNGLYPISSDFLEGDFKASMIYKYPVNGIYDIQRAIEKNCNSQI